MLERTKQALAISTGYPNRVEIRIIELKGTRRGEKQPEAMLRMEREKEIILYFPSTSNVGPCVGKQGLDMCSTCLGGQAYS